MHSRFIPLFKHLSNLKIQSFRSKYPRLPVLSTTIGTFNSNSDSKVFGLWKCYIAEHRDNLYRCTNHGLCFPLTRLILKRLWTTGTECIWGSFLVTEVAIYYISYITSSRSELDLTSDWFQSLSSWIPESRTLTQRFLEFKNELSLTSIQTVLHFSMHLYFRPWP